MDYTEDSTARWATDNLVAVWHMGKDPPWEYKKHNNPIENYYVSKVSLHLSLTQHRADWLLWFKEDAALSHGLL